MLGQKTARKGLWNRLTMQASVEPMVALAVAYACYPSPAQPHSLQTVVDARRAWRITEDFVDRGTIDLDTCCAHLFGKSSEEVFDAMLEDEWLEHVGSTTFYTLLRR